MPYPERLRTGLKLGLASTGKGPGNNAPDNPFITRALRFGDTVLRFDNKVLTFRGQE